MGTLPWHKIDEKTFEELVRGLAKHYISHVEWDTYLKKGYKQDGIDIYGFDTNSKKYACIQCKHCREMNCSLLEKWINKFEEGQFFSKANIFIIATTSDSQTRLIRDFFDTQTERLGKYSIELKLWDVKSLEDKLREQYGLVSYYFGLAVADAHCYSRNRHEITRYSRINNYINRQVVKIDNTKDVSIISSNWGNRKLSNFNHLFTGNYTSTKKICLIADAYQGKSTMLAQLAAELSDTEGYIPIYIKLKSHTLKPISNTLDESYSYWKQYPTREIVVILDGLDEVPRDQFDEFAKFIVEFTNSHKAINIVFSCRSLFFSHYRIHEHSNMFECYEIHPISEIQIDTYLSETLKRKKDFIKYINNSKLNALLSNPFYLVRLVEMYNKESNPQRLPRSKKDIIDFLIGESFKPAAKRRLIRGRIVEEEKNTFTLCIKRIALACQMIGANSLDIADVGVLFNEREQELLLCSSFLTVINSKWTFETAFFQENLAAMALIDMPYETILKVTTVGSIHKKVRMKWIQTIASFISLLPTNDERREKIVKLIEEDNIELLTFCDASKFDDAFILKITQEIIKKCSNQNSFPNPSSVDIIANFIRDSKKALLYLVSTSKNETTSKTIKFLCWKIIYNLNGLGGSAEIIKESALEILFNTSEGQLAGLMIDILSKFNLLTSSDIQSVAKMEMFLEDTVFLRALFEMLIANNIVDDYYFIGLNSIAIFEKYQSKYSQYGGQNILKKFLFHTKNSHNLYLLLRRIYAQEWSVVFDDSFFKNDRKEILVELRDLAIYAYASEPKVFFPMSAILKYHLQHNRHDEYLLLHVFCERTKTDLLLFQLCKKRTPIHSLNRLCYVITPECFDYIFGEYEVGKINQHTLEEWYYWILHWKKDENLAAAYYDRLVFVTNSQIKQIQEKSNLENSYWAEKREDNDLRIIQTAEAFKIGLVSFFQVLGKDSITESEIRSFYHIPPSELREVHSMFLAEFLLRISAETVTMEECLTTVSQVDWFAYFQAKQILNYNFPSKKAKRTLLPILENYFKLHICSVDFKNTYKQNDKKITCVKSHKLLGDIYLKYQFEVDKKCLVNLIWTITNGFNHLKKSDFTVASFPLLSNLLIENVDEELLVRTILSNLRYGISYDCVLSSHLEICRYLRINDIADEIITPKIFDRFPNYQQVHLLEIFNELGGSKDELLVLFNNLAIDFDKYREVLLALAKILTNAYPNDIRRVFESVLIDVKIEEIAKLDFARVLISLGSLPGYEFIVTYLANNVHNLDRMYHFLPTGNIPVEYAISELSKIKKHILDDNLPFSSSEYTIKEFLLNQLHAFAKRSEYDLIAVEQFLKDIHSENISHPNSKDIILNIDRILESFRDSSQSSFSVDDIKQFFF